MISAINGNFIFIEKKKSILSKKQFMNSEDEKCLKMLKYSFFYNNAKFK